MLLSVDGSEIPRPTTLWMFLKPCKQWDTLLPVCRISEPPTVGRFGESRCFFCLGGGDVRDLLVLRTMKL